MTEKNKSTMKRLDEVMQQADEPTQTKLKPSKNT